MTGWRQVGS